MFTEKAEQAFTDKAVQAFMEHLFYSLDGQLFANIHFIDLVNFVTRAMKWLKIYYQFRILILIILLVCNEFNKNMHLLLLLEFKCI